MASRLPREARRRRPPADRRSSRRLSLRFEPLEHRRLLSLTPYALPIQGNQQFVIAEFTPVGDEIFFQVDFSGTRYSLWKTDGTPQGTQSVDNLPGSSYTDSYGYLVETNGELYFSGSSRELWKSDGTAAGTYNVAGVDAWYLTNFNGMVYFSDGDDLWKSDGTQAGTVRVKEVGSMAHVNHYPRALTQVGGTLFFVDNDDVHGRELWKSDGTEEGTVLVKDINPGAASGLGFGGLTNVGGTLFFAANDGTGGTELWKSDGTEEGTGMVAQINPGAADADPEQLVNVGGTLYFAASGGTNGTELWKSDGTAGGTEMVVDIPGVADGSPHSMTEVNGQVYFGTSNDQLWKTDGTAAGSEMVASWTGDGPRQLINVNGTLLFRADDGTHGREPWRSDGTAAGTVMIEDLRAGPNESLPDDFLNFNGALIFSASGAGLFENFQPWVLPSVAVDLNGAAAGTDHAVNWLGSPVVIVDPAEAEIDSTGATLASMTATIDAPEAGDTLTADTSGTSIAASFDGTTLNLTGVDSVANYEQVLRSIAYHSTQSPAALSKTVTVAAVNELGGIHEAAVSTVFVNQQPQVDLNGPAAGVDADASWVGVEAGIVGPDATIFDPDGSNLVSLSVELLNPEAGDELSADVTGTGIAASFDGTTLLLSGNDTVANYQQVLRTVTYDFSGPNPVQNLRIVQVTATDTSSLASDPAIVTLTIPLVVDLNGQAAGTGIDRTWAGDPVPLAEPGAFLIVPGGWNVELLRVDISNPLPSDVLAANTGGTNITAQFTDGSLILSGTDSRANYAQVLRSITYDTGPTEAAERTMSVTVVDSQANSTDPAVATIEISLAGFLYLLKDIDPLSGSSDARDYVAVNTRTYFVADDGQTGSELWKTDGTEAGTVLVKDLNPGPAGASIAELTNVGGTLFFTGTDGVNSGLWTSDGTPSGTVLLKPIAASSLVNVGGTLLFVGNDGASGNEIWKSDGTQSGTVLVKDISSTVDSNPRYLTPVGATLFFVADDATHGGELWKSDGTESGTLLVKDIRVGPQSAFVSNPFSSAELENVNGVLYFRADDDVAGEAIWKSDGTESGTLLVADNPNPPLALTSFSAHNFTNVNGTLFFAAQHYLFGVELWKLSGGTAVQAADLQPGEGFTSSFPEQLTAIGNELYFAAADSADSILDLFVISASGGPAALLAEGLAPSQLTAVDDRLFFRGSNGTQGFELWQSDGTPAGTKMTADIFPGAVSSNPAELTNVHGALYFTAFGGEGTEPRVLGVPGTSTQVIGRHLFYNDSTFDNNTPLVDPADSAAIATDKSAYLPGGGTITPASTSSYTRGINGLFVDIAGPHGTLSLGDFEFTMSGQQAAANNTPSTWVPAPAPIGFTVLADTPAPGIDRVEFIWADNAIENRYLEVTVEGNDAAGGFNANTGLLSSDVFYFGNIIGDTFVDTQATVFLTSSADEIEIQGHIISAAPITSVHDVDRNGLHLGSDRIAVRGSTIAVLTRITIGDPPAAPQSAPSGEASAGLSAVAPALSVGPSVAPAAAPRNSAPPAPIDIGGHPVAAGGARIGEVAAPRGRALLAAADELDAAGALDDELLADLLADLL